MQGVACADAATLLTRVKFDVLALAPHTVEASKLALQRKSLTAAAHLFVPVFPISLEGQCARTACMSGAAASQDGFVLQGLFQPHRSALFTWSNLCISLQKVAVSFI